MPITENTTTVIFCLQRDDACQCKANSQGSSSFSHFLFHFLFSFNFCFIWYSKIFFEFFRTAALLLTNYAQMAPYQQIFLSMQVENRKNGTLCDKDYIIHVSYYRKHRT